MTPKQLAQHNTCLKGLSCELVKDSIDYATVFLWSDGIRTTNGIPTVIQHLVPDLALKQAKSTHVLPPSRRLLGGGNPAAAEFISRHHELLIGYDLRGWRGARDILCDFADRLTTEGKRLPLRLQQYLIWVARGARKDPSRKRGRDPYENVDRDFTIATAVRLVCELGGFRPTRNTITTTECGCSIVGKALKRLGVHMSEENVAAIWQASNKGNLFALVDRPLKRLILGKRS